MKLVRSAAPLLCLALPLLACATVKTSVTTLPSPLSVAAQDTQPGDVVTWGDGTFSAQQDVPDLPYGFFYKAISTTSGVNDPTASGGHTLGLWNNGEVVQWGDDNREDVPAPPWGLVYTAISAGENQNIGLWSNGQPVVWGYDQFGQKEVPRPPQGVNYTAVASGGFHLVGLRSDGTAVSWGATYLGHDQSAVKPGPYTAVAAGFDFSLALATDGTITAWGENDVGQLNVPSLPAGTRYIAIYTSASIQYSAALRSDGRLIVWGRKEQYDRFPLNVPALPEGQTFTAAALGHGHAYARTSSGAWLGWGYQDITNDMPILPADLTYTAVAAGGYIDSAIVGKPLSAPSPGGEDLYAVDFQTAPTDRILWDVRLGRGLSYLSSGQASAGKVRVDGVRFINGKAFGGNQAKVISTDGKKVLTVVKVGTTPNPSGGQLEIKPNASFGGPSRGKNGLVTLKSITVNGVNTTGAHLKLYGNGAFIKRIPLRKGETQTLELDEPNVGFIQVSVKNAFSVDNVVFDVPAASRTEP